MKIRILPCNDCLSVYMMTMIIPRSLVFPSQIASRNSTTEIDPQTGNPTLESYDAEINMLKDNEHLHINLKEGK